MTEPEQPTPPPVEPPAPDLQATAASPPPQQISKDSSRPAENFLLPDIERARDYRKEYYKLTIGIATALLAFTLAFQPTLKVAPENVWMEFAGWAGLGIAVAAGVRVHMTWSEFFITWRDHDNRGDSATGQRARSRLTTERRVLDFLLMAGLLIGVAGVIGFTATNLHNVALKG